MRCRNFLLIEDDEIDRRMFKRTLKKLGIEKEITEVANGRVAFDMLQEKGDDHSAYNYAIVLDLNLPEMSGHEFLERIREDEDLRKAVIFVMTSSELEEDVAKAYEKNVAGYFLKCEDIQEFQSTVRKLNDYCDAIEWPV